MNKEKEAKKMLRGNSMGVGKMDWKTAGRLLSYLRHYKVALVVICIILSSVASVASSLFIQSLIDDYIVPLLGAASPVYDKLAQALCIMAVIYLTGTLSTWIYNRTMVTVAQGTLKQIRDEMFAKMQDLPMRYFDTHTQGDIMSHYTNDTDTLRQMIAQSMAQLISSVTTIIAVFCCMLYQSVYLTLIVVVIVSFILQIVKETAVIILSGSRRRWEF